MNIRFLKILVILTLFVITSCTGGCAEPNRFKRYNIDSKISDLERIRQLIVDDNNNLWAVSENERVYLQQDMRENWEVIRIPEWLGVGDRVNSLFLTQEERKLYFNTNDGIAVYGIGTDEWIQMPKTGLFDTNIQVSLIDSKGQLWVGTRENGVFTFDERSWIWEHVAIEDGFSMFTVHAIFQDSQSSIWVAGNSLYRLKQDSNEWVLFSDGGRRFNTLANEWQNPPRESIKLSDDFIQSIAGDENGNLWFATLSGVVQYNPISDTWANFDSNDGLINDEVETVFIDMQNRVWFGTKEGVSQYNPTTQHWDSYDKESGYTNYATKDIVETNDGILLFATLGDGIFEFLAN